MSAATKGTSSGAGAACRAQELVHRFWLGTCSGGYVGHGETYLHEQDILWWSKGGVLHGESPARIAFLRRIVEEGPADGLEPVKTPTNLYGVGRADDYRLIYLAVQQPAEFILDLPAENEYQVAVIDTWGDDDHAARWPLAGTVEDHPAGQAVSGAADSQGRVNHMMSTTYRVLVSTDLGGDPDDIQSLIHLLHYSDILKVEGILSTAGPGSTPHAENIGQWVRRVDLDTLSRPRLHGLMREADVLAVIRQGARWPVRRAGWRNRRLALADRHAPTPPTLRDVTVRCGCWLGAR